MRLKALLADDENAVSPVIGVILMVAITVILAAVIASFVLGLGPSATAPTVNFDAEYNGSYLNIEVTGGDSVEAGLLSVRNTTGSSPGTFDWTTVGTPTSSSSKIGAGDTAAVAATSSYEVDVIWTSSDGGSTQTLSTFSA